MKEGKGAGVMYRAVFIMRNHKGPNLGKVSGAGTTMGCDYTP